ncbi:MAG TPA: hypothetical protein VHB73_03475 [Alphaproteobacteria bacterium]|nr:hypothetical protein [Alphaproteobacteria bacterium]
MPRIVTPLKPGRHGVFTDIDKAVAFATALEKRQKDRVDAAFRNYQQKGPEACAKAIRERKFRHVGAVYISIDASFFLAPEDRTLGINFFGDNGLYKGTLAHLELFGPKLAAALKEARKNHGLEEIAIEVGIDSEHYIPLDYALSVPLALDRKSEHLLPAFFKRLHTVDAENKRGIIEPHNSPKPFPLTFSHAERVYFEKGQYERYTNTSVEFATNCWFLFNFPVLMDLFLNLSQDILRGKAPAFIERQEEFVELITPGNLRYTRDNPDEPHVASLPPSPTNGQMPAYHLRRADGTGISCALIGTGPSNAKNFMDKLSVVRPELVVMAGICAGFGPGWERGDFVLASSFSRQEHILDDVLPPHVASPTPSHEVKQSLRRAVTEIFGLDSRKARERMRECIVMTVNDRESDTKSHIFEKVMQSHAHALEMESATVAACAFLEGYLHAFFGLMSDRPYTGDIRTSVSAHNLQKEHFTDFVQVLVLAAQLFQQREDRHSRKLRMAVRHPALNCA